MSQAESGNSLLIVMGASLDVMRNTPQGGLVLVNTLTWAAVFGEMVLCKGAPGSANAIWNVMCVLLDIQRLHLIQQIEENPQNLETMGTLMAHRQQTLQSISEERAETRIQTFIGCIQSLQTSTGQS